MLIASFPHAVARFLYPSLGYDLVAGFAPVTLIGLTPNIMVVPNSSPARSVAEFIAHAKANKLTFASSGVGTSIHLSGELFKRVAGIEMTHVPYRGGAPAVADLIPGRVDLMFNVMSSVLPQVRAGQMRGLAVTTAKRVARGGGVSDLRGSRAARIRGHGLVRILRAGEDAAGDRDEDSRRHGPRARRSGIAWTAGGPRHRRGRLDAGRARRVSQGGDGQMGAGDQGGGNSRRRMSDRTNDHRTK